MSNLLHQINIIIKIIFTMIEETEVVLIGEKNLSWLCNLSLQYFNELNENIL